ncbi:MFS transporter [Nocardioides sp.]|uniref:MFS transporter n=1 Tax=Nocardioides sp. TaxID=35761 RepID=UPI0039E290DD
MSPMREPAFRWFFLSRSVNLVGNTMAPVTLAFAVLSVSASATALGVVLAARTLPMVAFLLLGGVVADRWGRRLVIQGSSVLSGVSQGVIALLLLTGHAELWALAALSAVNGVVAAAGLPALNGIVPQLVPREQLQQANALLSLTRATLMVLGPGVAAAFVVTIGPGWALAIDALTWLLAAWLLAPVDLPTATEHGPGMLAELREGWDFFHGTTWLWLVVAIFAVLNALAEGGLNTLGPLRATTTDIGAGGWGLAMSAQALGALASTLALMRWRLERPLLLGMVGCAFFGMPMVVLGLWPSTWPVLAACFISGVGVQLFSLGWHVAMQEHVPEAMLSRAYSYDQLGSFAAIPVGQLAMGPLANAFGLSEVLLAAGVGYVVIALLPLLSSSVRGLPRIGQALSSPPH